MWPRTLSLIISREIIEQDDNVVFLGSSTYQSREAGDTATSLFAKGINGKI